MLSYPCAHCSVCKIDEPRVGPVQPSPRGWFIAQLSRQGGLVRTFTGKLNAQDSGTLPLSLSALNTPALYQEADRIERTLRGQMLAPRIAKVAVQAHGLDIAVRFRCVSSAVASEAISQGETVTMRPELALVGIGWKEKGTSHRRALLQRLFSC